MFGGIDVIDETRRPQIAISGHECLFVVVQVLARNEECNLLLALTFAKRDLAKEEEEERWLIGGL